MELFPVFLLGLGVVFVGAAALTVYIVFKAVMLT